MIGANADSFNAPTVAKRYPMVLAGVSVSGVQGQVAELRFNSYNNFAVIRNVTFNLTPLVLQ